MLVLRHEKNDKVINYAVVVVAVDAEPRRYSIVRYDGAFST